MSDQPRVRFAPSPTGFLHVGGARTALFNWLYARHHGGHFILRIEDTDLQRSSDEMVRAITEGLTWLGIDWDEEPFFQAERMGEHRQTAYRLLESGAAYRCFCDPAQLEAERLEAREQSLAWTYDGTCRRLDPALIAERVEANEPFAIRFRVPRDQEQQEVTFFDHVHGPMRVESAQIEDFVLLRSDGQPTYQLAVVVDDVWMRITHVIRGDDHLSNTFKQVLLYGALQAPTPHFAHLPLILGPDKRRLSKRHGATSIEEYREKGFLPEAMVNFLSLLGWSPGDDREFLRREELIELFDLDRVLKKPSVFDETKLEWLNGQYLNTLPAEALVAPARAAFVRAGHDLEAWDDAYLTRMMELMQERIRRFDELPEIAEYFFGPPHRYEPESVAKRWKKPLEAIERIQQADRALGVLESWNEETLEAAIRGLADQQGVGAGQYIHPIRVAVSGRHTGPGLFELLALLGQQEVGARLRQAITYLRTLTEEPDSASPGLS